MKKYSAIIIDDEEMARTLLQGMIELYCPEVTVVDSVHNLSNGVKSIRRHKPDIVFLDIEMPGHSGLELLDFFDEDEIDFSIIFVTAYHQYAIQAFKLSAVDYLLKPIDQNDLTTAIQTFQKRTHFKSFQTLKENFQLPNKKIALSVGHSIVFIPLSEIQFLRADGSYTHVYTTSGKSVMTSKNLKHYEDILCSETHFSRCHKSFIVNIHHIEEYVKSEGGYFKIGEHNISTSSDKTAHILALLK